MDDYFDLVEKQLGDLIERGAHRRRGALTAPRLPRLPLGGIALAASTAVVLVVAGLALLNVHRSQPPLPRARITDSAIDPSLVRDYEILRRSVTSADRLPWPFAQYGLDGVRRGMFSHSVTWLTREGSPPTVASIALLPELARRTTIPGTAYSAWLIPGRHGMCWFSANDGFPYDAVCVGPLEHPATALIDGPWTAVEAVDNAMVGLVTDRVRAVILVDASGRRHPLPLRDGFYLSPIPAGDWHLLAVTRAGLEPLYPQRLTGPQPPPLVGSASRMIARSSRPVVTVTGPRGLKVGVSWQMRCATRLFGSGPSTDVKGSESPQTTYRLPAVVPIRFPAASRNLRQCYLAAMVAARARQGAVHVAIVDR